MQDQQVIAAGKAVAANSTKMVNSVISSHVDGVAAYASKGMTVDIMRIGQIDGQSFGVRMYAAVENFTDNYSCNFNQESVFGRTDPLPSYQNTTRSISMQLVLAADNLGLAVKNLTDSKGIAQMLYPDYNAHSTQAVFARAPVVQMRWVNMITDGNALNRKQFLAGTINNYTITPDPEAGYFEYGVYDSASGLPESTKQPYDYEIPTSQFGLIPKTLRLSIDFTPLHEETVGFNSEIGDTTNIGGVQHQVNFPYITPDLPKALFTQPGWEMSSLGDEFIREALQSESFLGVDFEALSASEQNKVLQALGSDNAYANEINARNAEIMKQSNETTNPWTKMANKFSDLVSGKN